MRAGRLREDAECSCGQLPSRAYRQLVEPALEARLRLPGDVTVPVAPFGMVVFAHSSGSLGEDPSFLGSVADCFERREGMPVEVDGAR